MAFCRNCGAEIDDKAVICPKCGVQQQKMVASGSFDSFEDKGGFLWGLLGFCVPVVGLVLYLVWKDTKPKTSKSAGIGALSCVIAVISFYVLFFLLGILIAACVA